MEVTVSAGSLRPLLSCLPTAFLLLLIRGRNLVSPFAVSCLTTLQLARYSARTVRRRCKDPGMVAFLSVLSGLAILELPLSLLFEISKPCRSNDVARIVDYLRKEGALFNSSVTLEFCSFAITHRKYVRCSRTFLEFTTMSSKYMNVDSHFNDDNMTSFVIWEVPLTFLEQIVFQPIDTGDGYLWRPFSAFLCIDFDMPISRTGT